VQGFGSVCRSTTFYRTNDNKIRVVCGCFSGTIKEFKKKVKKTYGYTKLGREYLKLARLVEYRMRS
jgi:hypothetical protein